jgi:hypothetical protein
LRRATQVRACGSSSTIISFRHTGLARLRLTMYAAVADAGSMPQGCGQGIGVLRSTGIAFHRQVLDAASLPSQGLFSAAIAGPPAGISAFISRRWTHALA